MSKKVLLGSLNPVKVESAKQVLEPLGFEVESQGADSGVAKQPFSDDETILGARNRAKSIRSVDSNCITIGLEAGVQEQDDKLILVNWGVLIDEDGNEYLAGGTRIPISEDIAKYLYRGYELAEAIDLITNLKDVRSKQGSIGVMTNNLVQRTDIFTHIISLLVGQYLVAKA